MDDLFIVGALGFGKERRGMLIKSSFEKNNLAHFYVNAQLLISTMLQLSCTLITHKMIYHFTDGVLQTNHFTCFARVANLQLWPQPTHSTNSIFPTHFCNSIPANQWAEQNKPRIKNVLKRACNFEHSSYSNRALKLYLTFDLLRWRV